MTASSPETRRDPRLIDPGLPPTRYARGWHCLGLADSFRDGKPLTVQAFGTMLVVWADIS
jgi:3-ketosteroid 9alpha-monooxygenase subunit A